jgi:signal transduction histidine kinase
VLQGARVSCAIIDGSRSVAFVSDEVRELLGVEDDERPLTVRKLESRLGAKLPPLGEPMSARMKFGATELEVSLVPLAGGAEGAALIFHREASGNGDREDVLANLRALREALTAAGRYRAADPLLEDTAATLGRIVSKLDAPPPEDESVSTQPHNLPGSVPQVVRQVAARYRPIAGLKGIDLHVDLQETHEIVRDATELQQALETFLENSIHYVPRGGQVFVGARTTTQKGRPLALFFVMDNGPDVPEEYRKVMFLPDFLWDGAAPERTGRNLAFCNSFALRHGGQCWVDVKPGKSCTFFLSMKVV